MELITRTIDTQTPSAYIEELRISDEPVREWASVKEDTNGGENQSGQSSRSQSESPDFGLIPGNLDTSRPSSRDETPPAEGCESPVVTKEATPGRATIFNPVRSYGWSSRNMATFIMSNLKISGGNVSM